MLKSFLSRFRSSANADQILAHQSRPARGEGPSGARDAFEAAANFRFPASENMIGDLGSERLLKVIKSFAPSQPTQSMGQFAGRMDVLSNVVVAVEEHRNHLVLFGGRGTGKTSLSLALSSIARQVGYHCAYISCSRESSVESIFRSALSELAIRFDQHFDPRTEDIDPTINFDSLLPEGHISPQALVDILARIRGTRLLVVIDEYDRNENPTLTRDMTEIMKVVSDRAIPVQIVIVGVGDVVDNLVGEHASVARVLYVVRLSNMTDDQIRDILAVASRFAGITMEPAVVDSITAISHGRPYIARLVGLKAAKMALLRGSVNVEPADFEAGTNELLHYLASAGFGLANRLIVNSKINLTLFNAMLSCKRDSSDRFAVEDVMNFIGHHAPYEQRDTVERAIAMIASPELGLLQVIPGAITMYQFVDPRAELCVSILCEKVARTSSAAQAPAAAVAAG
jgi:hypothetical protein